ncbi:MAG: DUF2480 family protein [Bacteroidota bacterium]
MEQAIVNRVANSSLVTIDLEDYYPHGEKIIYDIADQLFQGLILREKDFRDHIKTHDWSQYKDKYVAVYCSADAIVPTWAYMLLTSKLVPDAKDIVFGDLEELNRQLTLKKIRQINAEDYQDAKIVIKGCGDLNIGAYAYLEITKILQPYSKSIMYGEPCSMVPVYKKKRPGK